jgi:hypothetical protein
MMFEGGSHDSFYEGGSGDEDDMRDEDDAQTVKTKTKKKKKKGGKRGETFKAKETTINQRLDESAFNPDTQGEANPLQGAAEELVIDDIDGKSVKSKKSKRSVSKKKSLKKKATEGETSPTKTED